MRTFLIFADGTSIVSGGIYIRGDAEQPLEEIDISFLSEKDYEKLVKNPKDKIIRNLIDEKVKK